MEIGTYDLFILWMLLIAVGVSAFALLFFMGRIWDARHARNLIEDRSARHHDDI